MNNRSSQIIREVTQIEVLQLEGLSLIQGDVERHTHGIVADCICWGDRDRGCVLTGHDVKLRSCCGNVVSTKYRKRVIECGNDIVGTQSGGRQPKISITLVLHVVHAED